MTSFYKFVEIDDIMEDPSSRRQQPTTVSKKRNLKDFLNANPSSEHKSSFTDSCQSITEGPFEIQRAGLSSVEAINNSIAKKRRKIEQSERTP